MVWGFGVLLFDVSWFGWFMVFIDLLCVAGCLIMFVLVGVVDAYYVWLWVLWCWLL